MAAPPKPDGPLMSGLGTQNFDAPPIVCTRCCIERQLKALWSGASRRHEMQHNQEFCPDGRPVQYSQANTVTSGEQLFCKPLTKVVTKQTASWFREGSKPKMMLVIAAAVGRNCTVRAQFA